MSHSARPIRQPSTNFIRSSPIPNQTLPVQSLPVHQPSCPYAEPCSSHELHRSTSLHRAWLVPNQLTSKTEPTPCKPITEWHISTHHRTTIAGRGYHRSNLSTAEPRLRRTRRLPVQIAPARAHQQLYTSKTPAPYLTL